MAWTDDRVEILTKLWGEGLSASQIARELGDVTRNAVIGKVHRLGLAGRASPTRPKSRVRHREPSNFSSNFDSKDRFSENLQPYQPQNQLSVQAVSQLIFLCLRKKYANGP